MKLRSLATYILGEFRRIMYRDLRILSLDQIRGVIEEHIIIRIDYFILLWAAGMISTLGLLMNSTPVIVGGMIISPLMWPLIGIAYGLWRGSELFLRRSLSLLGISILFTIFTAWSVTLLSPLKVVNDEILARTAPTVLDLIVALLSGGVAMIGITNRRVSSTLAGVAIATSLMPPICVAGIGFALFDRSIALGGLILFLTNTVAIVLVSVLYLIFTGTLLYHQITHYNKKGILFIGIMLVMLALPLTYTLSTYSYELTSFARVQSALKKQLQNISPDIRIDHLQVIQERDNSENVLVIDADVSVPQDIDVRFDTKESITQALQEVMNIPIDLQLHIKKTVGVEEPYELSLELRRDKLLQAFRQEIASRSANTSIDSLSASFSDQVFAWNLIGTLRSEPSTVLSETDRKNIEKILADKIHEKVILSLDIIPRIQLKSDVDNIRTTLANNIESFLETTYPAIEFTSLDITRSSSDSGKLSQPSTIVLAVKIFDESIDTEEMIENLKSYISTYYKEPFALTVLLSPYTRIVR